MEKPEALKELIDELKTEGVTDAIEAEPGAYAVIKWPGEAGDEEVRLTSLEARLLLASEETVEELLDILSLDDEQAHIELKGLSVSDSAMEILMFYFQTVDEV